MSTKESKELTTKEYSLTDWLQSPKFSRNLMEIMQTEEAVRRFVQIGLNAVKRQPELVKCTQSSVLDSLLKLSQINLEPDGYHAHLVPFNNKIKWKDEKGQWQERWEKQAQLIIDYKGLITVVRRDPLVSVFKGNLVYAKDIINYEEGSERKFIHKPTFQPRDKSNPIVFVYSFIKWTHGDWDVEIMTVDEVERIRARSRAKDSGPWVDFWGEMGIKTAMRKMCKRLPLRPEQREAVTADDDQYEFENPFGKEPQLTYTRPEFRSDKAKQTPQRDSVEIPSASRESAELDRTTETSRGDSGTRKETSQAEATRPAETKQEPVEEKEHRYGPGDESNDEASARSVPGDDMANASTGKREIGGTTRSDVGQEEQAATAEPSKALQKLYSQINKEKLTQDEVIRVLLEHDQNVGDAENTGMVSDLPAETIELTIKNFGSIVFGVKKIRKAQAG